MKVGKDHVLNDEDIIAYLKEDQNTKVQQFKVRNTFPLIYYQIAR